MIVKEFKFDHTNYNSIGIKEPATYFTLEGIMSKEEVDKVSKMLWDDGLRNLHFTTENKDDHIKTIYVDEIKKTVVVKFRDGTIQKSKCAEGDEFDVEVGVAICIAMKQFRSKTEFRNLVAKKIKKTRSIDPSLKQVIEEFQKNL